MSMRKPLKFKSGFFTWKIIWSEEAVSEMFGKTDEVNKTITMYKHSNKQAERETLFHELLHAVGAEFYESIFNFEQDKKEIDKEENLVRILSPLLMQVLSDNKDLARYLFKV